MCAAVAPASRELGRYCRELGRYWLTRLSVLLSVLLFAAALYAPAIALHGGQGAVSGARILGSGWRGLQHGYFEWLANPCLLASWVCSWVGWKRLSLIAACVACALALAFLARGEVARTGYWLWVCSAAAMISHGLAAREG
ncbi:MAG TPA: hypothetical protein VJQ47_08720 [Steroidobacteraceae bacterium]|nr:hypothetical protein [Steroidobacteraceae bacterium]